LNFEATISLFVMVKENCLLAFKENYLVGCLLVSEVMMVLRML